MLESRYQAADPLPKPLWDRRLFEKYRARPIGQYRAGIYTLAFVIFLVVWVYVIPAVCSALRDHVLSVSGGAIVFAGMVGHMVCQWSNGIWLMSYLTLGVLFAIWAFPWVPIRRVGWVRVLSLTVLFCILAWIVMCVRSQLLVWPDLQWLREALMFLLICLFWEICAKRLEKLIDRLNAIRKEEVIGARVDTFCVYRFCAMDLLLLDTNNRLQRLQIFTSPNNDRPYRGRNVVCFLPSIAFCDAVLGDRKTRPDRTLERGSCSSRRFAKRGGQFWRISNIIR
jgi:hypothetical protein